MVLLQSLVLLPLAQAPHHKPPPFSRPQLVVVQVRSKARHLWRLIATMQLVHQAATHPLLVQVPVLVQQNRALMHSQRSLQQRQ